MGIQEAGIPRKFAPTIGIAVDPRRANLSTESLAANVERLKAYQARLILFPRRVGKHKADDADKETVKTHKEEGKGARLLGKVLPIENVEKAQAIGSVKTSEIPSQEGSVYRKLRDARSDARLVGVREKRAKAKAEESANATK